MNSRSGASASRSPRVRDPEASRARLLAAATEEFAEHGIAGARIDRIGATAGVNKAQIYSYFGNKDQLFDVVLEVHVARILDQVPFAADDLPGYAGRLFDYVLANPHQLRLMIWNRLERTGTRPGPSGLSNSAREKVHAIEKAQADGCVRSDFTAADLLSFTMALIIAWTPVFPMPLGSSDTELSQHRDPLIRAVRQLVTA